MLELFELELFELFEDEFDEEFELELLEEFELELLDEFELEFPTVCRSFSSVTNLAAWPAAPAIGMAAWANPAPAKAAPTMTAILRVCLGMVFLLFVCNRHAGDHRDNEPAVIKFRSGMSFMDCRGTIKKMRPDGAAAKWSNAA